MDYNQIINDLKNKVYHPIYFLMGDEPYFIDKISDFISEKVLDAAEKEFNQSVLYGKDIDTTALISALKRYPMMANHQVVIVKEAQNIRDIERLATYVENPLKSTILVLCYKFKTLDKRKSFTKLVDKNGILFESKRLYDNKIPEWIDNYLNDKDYIIGHKAVTMITEFLGNDLGKIANELEKLMINLPEKSEITTEHIEKYIGISKDYNNFELQEAISKKDVVKATRIVYYFEKNSRNNPLILTIINLFGYFTKVLKYHYAPDKRNSKEVAAMLGVNPFFVKEYEIAAQNYNIKKTVEVIALLREYDLKSKGLENVSGSDGDILKELVYKIMH